VRLHRIHSRLLPSRLFGYCSSELRHYVGGGAEEGGDAQFAGFPDAASGAGAVRGRRAGLAGGAHGGGPSAGKLGVFGVGPGEGGGEAGDGGGEIGGFGAGDGVEFAGEGVAEGGVLLFGFVVEQGDVVAGEAYVEVGGAEGVGSTSGPRASSMRSRGQVSRALGISSSRQNHLAMGGGHELHFPGGDGGGHLGAGPAEECCRLRDADVGAWV
jgi:hypothetical protein